MATIARARVSVWATAPLPPSGVPERRRSIPIGFNDYWGRGRVRPTSTSARVVVVVIVCWWWRAGNRVRTRVAWRRAYARAHAPMMTTASRRCREDAQFCVLIKAADDDDDDCRRRVFIFECRRSRVTKHVALRAASFDGPRSDARCLRFFVATADQRASDGRDDDDRDDDDRDDERDVGARRRQWKIAATLGDVLRANGRRDGGGERARRSMPVASDAFDPCRHARRESWTSVGAVSTPMSTHSLVEVLTLRD